MTDEYREYLEASIRTGLKSAIVLLTIVQTKLDTLEVENRRLDKVCEVFRGEG